MCVGVCVGVCTHIASLLKVELTPAKRATVVKNVDFNTVKASGGMGSILLRKGGFGGWAQHLGPAEWDEFDAAFDAALEGVALAEPLRAYQQAAVGGLPPPRAAQVLVHVVYVMYMYYTYI